MGLLRASPRVYVTESTVEQGINGTGQNTRHLNVERKSQHAIVIYL